MDSSYTTAGAAAPAQNGTNTTSHTGQEPIAIVSVACRLPGHCMNPQQLWEFLINGGVATSNSPPESRFNIKGHFDGSRKTHTMISPGGMFIEDIDLQAFDAQFFNVNRADTIAMEPQQRQILEVVYECLENGGVPLESLTGKEVGCFVASYAVGKCHPCSWEKAIFVDTLPTMQTLATFKPGIPKTEQGASRWVLVVLF